VGNGSNDWADGQEVVQSPRQEYDRIFFEANFNGRARELGIFDAEEKLGKMPGASEVLQEIN
jgi:hypothetical protein